MIQLIKGVFNALIFPQSIVRAKNPNLIMVLTILLKLFFFKILVSIGLLLILDLFETVENNSLQNIEESLGLPLSFLIIVLIGPLYEEVIFRLPLKYKPIYLSLSVFTVSYIFFSSIIFGSNFLELDFSLLYKLIFSFLLSITVYIWLSNTTKISNFWAKNLRLVYICSILIFGLSHTLNFELNEGNYYLLPILISPHLIAAIILNYLRMKFGFIYCFLFHFSNNLFVFILS